MERHRHAYINRKNGSSPMREFFAWERREFRRLLILEYGPYCQLCLAEGKSKQAAKIDLEVPGKARSWSIDHIVAMSKGGRNEFENMWPSHMSCNRIRGNSDIPQRKVYAGAQR